MEEQTRSLSEVAGLMGVSERTVRRWIQSGRLRAYKPGRDYRIPESGLRAFIKESEISPKVQAPPSLELSFNDVMEERRALAYVRPWFALLEKHAEHLEDLATPGRFNSGEYLASDKHYVDIIASLNVVLRQAKSEGFDVRSGPIGQELGDAMRRLSPALRASAKAAVAALSGSELEQVKRRKAEREAISEQSLEPFLEENRA